MKFVCDRCQTKYSIPDERVRGKVLKVKCKTCANVITVREARSTAAAGVPVMSAAAPAARPRTGANLALSVPDETPAADSERTQLAHYPPDPNADPFPDLDAFAPPSPVAPKRKTGQMAPLDADDGVQWYMALDGNRTGPFSRGKLVDHLMPLAKGADVHVWNERLGSWKAPKDVPEVAAELTRRRAPAPPVPRRPTPPPIPPLSGFGGHSMPAGAPRKPTPHAPPSPIGQTGSGVPSKWAYLPFSIGPRICAGMSFGFNEAVICLATLAQRFILKLEPGHVVAPVCQVSLRPGEALPMRLHRRERPAVAAPAVMAAGEAGVTPAEACPFHHG